MQQQQVYMWVADEVMKAASCPPPPGHGPACASTTGPTAISAVSGDQCSVVLVLDNLLLAQLWRAFVPLSTGPQPPIHTPHSEITWLFCLHICIEGAAAAVGTGLAVDSAASGCPVVHLR